MIEGFDGVGTTLSPMGKPIFKPHTVSEDLPKANGTKDFDVPASAAKGLVISDDPA